MCTVKYAKKKGIAMKKSNTVILTTLLCVSFLSSTAFAESRPGIHPLLTDDFTGKVGLLFANTESNLAADGSIDSAIGDNIDFQKDLGFKDTDGVFAANFNWRFTEKFHASLEYITISQDASATLNKDISWGDLDFAEGANVKADLNVDIARLFVGYSFKQTDEWELGAGLGLHLMDLEAQLSGNATINGVPTTNATEKKDFLAPLPNIGGYGAYAFSSKLIVTGRVDWFSANTGDYDGGLLSMAADVQYQVFENIGIGAGYQYLNVDISVDTTDWFGGADYTYQGPKLYITINF